MQSRQEPIYQALRLLTDDVPKAARAEAIREFANKHCRHELTHDGECCDCGLRLAPRQNETRIANGAA
jgi:hypothetical protein